jgi:hypothetical protein
MNAIKERILAATRGAALILTAPARLAHAPAGGAKYLWADANGVTRYARRPYSGATRVAVARPCAATR